MPYGQQGNRVAAIAVPRPSTIVLKKKENLFGIFKKVITFDT